MCVFCFFLCVCVFVYLHYVKKKYSALISAVLHPILKKILTFWIDRGCKKVLHRAFSSANKIYSYVLLFFHMHYVDKDTVCTFLKLYRIKKKKRTVMFGLKGVLAIVVENTLLSLKKKWKLKKIITHMWHSTTKWVACPRGKIS